MKIVKTLNTILDRSLVLLAILAGILVVLVMLLVTGDVLFRYALSSPIRWAPEITEIFILYIAFLGTAWVLKRDGHIKLDLVMRVLSPKAKNTLLFFSYLVCFAICCIIFWFGIKTTLLCFERNMYDPTVMEFPIGPIVAIIPVGTFFLILEFARKLIRLFQKEPVSGHETET